MSADEPVIGQFLFAELDPQIKAAFGLRVPMSNPLPQFSQFELPGDIIVMYDSKAAQLTIYFPRSNYDDLSNGVLFWLFGPELADRLQRMEYLPLHKHVDQPFGLSGHEVERVRRRICKLRGV